MMDFQVQTSLFPKAQPCLSGQEGDCLAIYLGSVNQDPRLDCLRNEFTCMYNFDLMEKVKSYQKDLHGVLNQ